MALGKNVVEVLLRLVDQLSGPFRKSSQEVKKGSQEMAEASKQAAGASGQAATATKQEGEAAAAAAPKRRRMTEEERAAAAAARDVEKATRQAAQEETKAKQQQKKATDELRSGYQQLAIAATAVMFAMTMAINRGIDANNRQISAFTGLRSIVVGTGKDYNEASQFVKQFTEDGLISQARAAEALKNLLQRGFSLDEAIDMLNRLKDAAAFGRQAHLDMGAAVASATEGLKNENSILVDNAGVTKNVSVMWKEYARELGKGVQSLTQAEKRQAEYNGILKETRHQVGDATKMADSFAGQQARSAKATEEASAALGRAWAGALEKVLPLWTGFVNGLKTAMDKFPGLTVAIMALVGGFAALVAAAGIWVTVSTTAVMTAMTAIATKAGIMWAAITGPIGLAIIGLTALAGALYYVTTAQTRAAQAAVDNARKQEEAAKETATAARNHAREVVKQEEDMQSQLTAIQQQAAAKRSDIHQREMEDRRDQANRFGELLVSALRKRYAEQQDAEVQAIRDRYDTLKASYEEEYRQAKDAHDREADAAQDHADQMKDAARRQADGQLDELRQWADAQERILRDARDRELALLDAETDAAVDAKQDEIDAIDAATREEDRQARDQRRQARIDEMTARLATLDDIEEIAEVQAQIADLVVEREREALLRSRDAQKEALRQEIEELRKAAQDRRQTIEQRYKEELDQLRTATDEKKRLIEDEKVAAVVAAEEAYKAKKNFLDQALAAQKQVHDDGLAMVQKNRQDEETAVKAKYDQLTSEANVYAEALKLVHERNQQEILALLNQYEPDWTNQGKDFVQRLAEGGQEAKPAVDALVDAIGTSLMAATENVQHLRDAADDGVQELARTVEQLNQAKAALEELQATRRQAEAEADHMDRIAAQAEYQRIRLEEELKAAEQANLDNIEKTAERAGHKNPYEGHTGPVSPTGGGASDSDPSYLPYGNYAEAYQRAQGSRHGGGTIPFSGAYRLLEGERVLSRQERQRYEVLNRIGISMGGGAVRAPGNIQISPIEQMDGGLNRKINLIEGSNLVSSGRLGTQSTAGSVTSPPQVIFDFRGSNIRSEQDADALMRKASRQFLDVVRQNMTPGR